MNLYGIPRILRLLNGQKSEWLCSKKYATMTLSPLLNLRFPSDLEKNKLHL